MEEFENEYDKGIYWVIFFIGLLIIGLIGHYFVFSYLPFNINTYLRN